MTAEEMLTFKYSSWHHRHSLSACFFSWCEMCEGLDCEQFFFRKISTHHAESWIFFRQHSQASIWKWLLHHSQLPTLQPPLSQRKHLRWDSWPWGKKVQGTYSRGVFEILFATFRQRESLWEASLPWGNVIAKTVCAKFIDKPKNLRNTNNMFPSQTFTNNPLTAICTLVRKDVYKMSARFYIWLSMGSKWLTPCPIKP